MFQGHQDDEQEPVVASLDELLDVITARLSDSPEMAAAHAYVTRLIAERDHDGAHAEHLAETRASIDADETAAAEAEVAKAIAAGVAPPTAVALLAARTDMLTELAGDLENVAEAGDDPEEAEIVMSASNVENVADLLLASAVAVTRLATPAEILINCHGGMVQDVIVSEGSNPVTVYVEDNDDGEEPGADEDEDMAHLKDEEGKDPDYDFSAALYRTEGTPFASDGRRWTSLRAEADRLEAREAAAQAAYRSAI